MFKKKTLHEDSVFFLSTLYCGMDTSSYMISLGLKHTFMRDWTLSHQLYLTKVSSEVNKEPSQESFPI